MPTAGSHCSRRLQSDQRSDFTGPSLPSRGFLLNEPPIQIELHACAACGAVVVDQDRHFDWHAAIQEGAGRALAHRPDYKLIGLVDAAPADDGLVPGHDLLPGEDLIA